MKRIFKPTSGAADWQSLLAKPERHWKSGFSAMSLAYSWEAADGGFPPEISHLLESAGNDFNQVRLLAAWPEYQVPLPGGSRATQCDVFALARSNAGLIAIAIEGKVDEQFGPTLEQKNRETDGGVPERIGFLCRTLGLKETPVKSIRYQLLHRTAAAVLLAKEFTARTAVMLVHSFSSEDRWANEFGEFTELFGTTIRPGDIRQVGTCSDVTLYMGWCRGDQRFRRIRSP